MQNQFRIDIKKDGIEASISQLLQKALSLDLADRIFSPQYDELGTAVYSTLISDPKGFAKPAIFAPYLNGNNGREAGPVSRDSKRDSKAIVMVRPCEARAFIELAKLGQADRQRVILITCDCPGTLSLDEYKRFREKYDDQQPGIEAFYSEFCKGKRFADFKIRDSCTYCESLSRPDSDISICIVGAEKGEIVIRSGSESGEKVLNMLGLKDVASLNNELRTKFIEEQRECRNKLDDDWSKEIVSIDNFLSLLRYCRRCYNCRAECPICYCRECVFQTTIFEVAPEIFSKRADRHGVIKMPSDTLIFHLTRMNHMASSCVECGQCTEACPQKIPVGRIFSNVGKRVQDLFGYKPGTNVADELPMTIYKEKELEPL